MRLKNLSVSASTVGCVPAGGGATFTSRYCNGKLNALTASTQNAPICGRLILIYSGTLEYLIAEQDGIREQDGTLSKKVKRAGWNKRAGWKFVAKS